LTQNPKTSPLCPSRFMPVSARIPIVQPPLPAPVQTWWVLPSTYWFLTAPSPTPL
jgi:hypothetical protein